MWSSFKHFSHLGHIWPDPEEITPPGNQPALLLEDGVSFLLQEDGVSKLLLE